MSFFWSTSYTPTTPAPPPTPVVKKVEPVVVLEQPTPTTPIPTPVSIESNRSVPTADAFRQPHVTHVPRKKVNLTVDTDFVKTETVSIVDTVDTVDTDSVVKTKTVSIADAETPLNSGYNSPRYDVQFMDDEQGDVFVYSEPCTPTGRRCASAVFPLVETNTPSSSDIKQIVHRLEHLFEKGLYQHSNVVHQGVYNGSVLNGGYITIPSPDRDDLDVNSDFSLYNSNRDVSREERSLELHRNYLDLIAQNYKILQRLEVLTNQFASELCI